MALLINDISVNQAQVTEIYTSYLNSRKLGEAMSLPVYVIDEVRRQIRDEGLRYLKLDTTIKKKVPFTINHAKNEIRQAKPAVKTPSEPVVSNEKPPAKREQIMQPTNSKMSLSDSILVLLATSKNIMQPQELNSILNIEHAKLSSCLKELKNQNLIICTPNGRYTLSKGGEQKVKVEFPKTAVHPNVFKRIERYSTSLSDKVPIAKAPPVVGKPDDEVFEMMDHLLKGDDELDQVDIELARLDCSLLNEVDVKVKILHTLSNKLGGKVGAHLAELQSFISR
jgi:hypothetical protein